MFIYSDKSFNISAEASNGQFYDAVEDLEILSSDDEDLSPHKDPAVKKLKNKLTVINRKRAQLRNKKVLLHSKCIAGAKIGFGISTEISLALSAYYKSLICMIMGPEFWNSNCEKLS